MKWIKDLRPEIIKLLEKTISSLASVMVEFFFFVYVPSDNGNKNKNKQMGLYQTKKLLHNGENYQQNESQPTKWE